MFELNPNNILPFGIDPSRANLAIVSISENPAFFKIRNDQRSHRGFLNKVAKMASETGRYPVFAVEGNSPFAIGFEFEAYRRGYPVYEITPHRLSEMREVLCGEDQTDYRDAKTAALIITHIPQLLRPASLDLKQFALKRLVKIRLRLVKDQTRNINLLHNHLAQIWGPSYKDFFPVLNSSQALTFFAIFPTPGYLNLETERILTYLADTGLAYYRSNWGKKRVGLIMDKVRRMNWRGDEYLSELDWEAERIELVRTIPGFDWVLACSAVVLIGDLSRFERSSDFIAYCGLVLCAKDSGNTRRVKKRKRRNKMLSYVFYQAALASLHSSELSQKYYQKKLSEGKDSKQALRALAKKLAEITYAVLKNKEPYDEKRHLN
jgi:transposase